MQKRPPLTWLFAVLLALVPARAWAQSITEFPLPRGQGLNYGMLGYGRAIAAGPDGNLWMTDATRSSVIRVTAVGENAEFSIPGGVGGISVGSDGGIWVTGSKQVTRLSTDGHVTGQFFVQYGPDVAGIVAGPDGNLWFTEANPNLGTPGGAINIGAVGHVTPSGGVTEYRLPADTAASGIIVGPDRNLWFIWSGALGRLTPQGVVSVIQMSPATGALAALNLGPDGDVWFTVPATVLNSTLDDTVGYVGRITPSGVVTQYAVPTPHAYPFDIVAGPDGNLWFTEMKANKIGRITPQGLITEFPVPTPDAQPSAICVGPDGNIWFTESKAEKVARLALSGPAAGNVILTVPAAASAAGANGTFFHTDLWLMNRSFTSVVVATLTYRCATGLACGNAVQPVTLRARQSVMLTDVIGRTFDAPNTFGAIEVSWPTTSGPVSASSQVSSPLPPAPAFGTLVPALPLSAAKMHSVFIGVASGGSLTSGSRSNAGVYNPEPVPVNVTFELHKGDGTTLGTYSRTYQPNEAYQLFPNVFDLLGVGSTAAKDAYLVVTATAPVFPYVTVIDNVSGDSSFLSASDDETAP